MPAAAGISSRKVGLRKACAVSGNTPRAASTRPSTGFSPACWLIASAIRSVSSRGTQRRPVTERSTFRNALAGEVTLFCGS
jgi:hypothetical protein